MKKEAGKKIIQIILAALMLYNIVLVAGGRGPFSLYRGYWSCHCDDTSTYDRSGDDFLSGLIPMKTTEDLLDDVESGRISLDTFFRKMEASTSDADNMCKRKLPLKYVSLVATNIIFQISASTFRLPGCQYDVLHSYFDARQSPAVGFARKIIKPPRA